MKLENENIYIYIYIYIYETFINNCSGNDDLHFAPNQKWNPIWKWFRFITKIWPNWNLCLLVWWWMLFQTQFFVTNIKHLRKIIHTHSKFEEKIYKTTLSSHSNFLFKREVKKKMQFLSGTFKWVYIHPIGAKVEFVRSAQVRPFKTELKKNS